MGLIVIAAIIFLVLRGMIDIFLEAGKHMFLKLEEDYEKKLPCSR
jgi:hypothetical protein